MDIVEQQTSYGIPYKKNWPMSRVRTQTKLHCDYWLDDLYNYNEIAVKVERHTRAFDILRGTDIPGQELDEFMWEEWTKVLEDSRKFVVESLEEFGINECEAHFLSIKFCMSTISKFRLKMFIEFGGQEGKPDFQKTALRNAINILAHRLGKMTVHKGYMWSNEAAEEHVSAFKADAARETARLLVEETGAILHAKLVL